MKNCVGRFVESKVSNELRNLIGNNTLLENTMMLKTTNGFEFEPDFKEWYAEKKGKDAILDLNPKYVADARKLAKAIMDYYKEKYTSIHSTVRQEDANSNRSEFGYTSTFEREAGKKHVATMLLRMFNEIQNKGLDVDANYNYYFNKIKRAWCTHIFQSVAKQKKKDVKELRQEYEEAEDKNAYIDKLLGGKNKSISNSNIFAVYQELFASDNTANAYVREVFANPILAEVYRGVRRTMDELNDVTKEEVNTSDEKTEVEPEENAKADDTELDTSITNANNHIGIYTSFMAHVGGRIKNYFNTLRKQQSAELGDFDTNNTYGIAETMDANECASMLYNANVNFDNIESMIESIQHIANTIKGFEAFAQLAEDLRNNRDFATEMRTVFSKLKISKIKTTVSNGKVNAVVTNSTADPQTTLVGAFKNDIASTSISDNPDVTENLIEEAFSWMRMLSKSENNAKGLKALNEVITRTTHIAKLYYPSIQENAIRAYIELNSNDGATEFERKADNAEALLNDLKECNKKVRETKENYRQLRIKANKVNEHNRKLKDRARKNYYVDPNDYQSLSDVYGSDWLKAQNNSLSHLARKLTPYSVINTDLNSRNIHGNNNSNIINSSMITNLNRILEKTYTDEHGRTRNKALEAWGAKKLRSKQYKYSNILLEQKDENGKVINRGMFRYVDGVLCITEDASNLLKFYQYEGAEDIDKGNAASYKEMLTGSFLPSSFMNFFKADRYGVKDIANYFMRVPSDAPNTFLVQAPRYKAGDVVMIKDEEAFNNDVKEIVAAAVPLITKEAYMAKYRADAAFPYTIDYRADYEKIMFGKESMTIKDAKAVTKLSEPDADGNYEALVNVATKYGNAFIFKGTIKPAGKGIALHNRQLVGALNTTLRGEDFVNTEEGAMDVEFPIRIATEHFEKQLRFRDVTVGDTTWKAPEYTGNPESQVFKMLKNQFYQNLLDGAVALNHYFELVEETEGENKGTYHVRLENGRPVFNSGMRNDKGYKFYHLGEEGTVLEETEDGVKLGGKVFHDEKFSLAITDENGDVVKKGYLDEVITSEMPKVDLNTGQPIDDGSINFLYGGAMRIIANRDSEGVLHVEDIKLSEAQEKKVNEALSKFVLEYRKQVTEAVERYKDMIQGVEINNYNIMDYAFNNLIMYMNYDQLTDGDVRFYKDGQTVLKRAKQYQGSGNPFGISDYSAEHEDDLSDIEDAFLTSGSIQERRYEVVVKENGKKVRRVAKDDNGKAIYDTVKIQDIFKGSIFEGVTQRRGFRAATIKNTIRTNVKALKQLENKFIKEIGLSEDMAKELLWGPIQLDKNGKPKVGKDGGYDRRGGFTDTKVNDAQSYITVQEFVRRIAGKGQFNRYLPLIKKLIAAENDPSVKLSGEDIKEFIQVQKNFYYDLWYDARYDIEVPRQIKNAEFVLVPSLIKGTQLEDVYNMMREAGIDQLNTVETSKAANEYLTTVWDNDGNMPGITDAKDDAARKQALTAKADELNKNAMIYSYNNLYTQQETPQHLDSQNKAGIQIVKKMFDNIDPNGPLQPLKDEFFKIFSSNIQTSFENIAKELNIPLDENGNIAIDENNRVEGLNMAVLYNKLKEELIRTGLDNNLADYVTILDGASRATMPSYMNNVLTKFESVFQSIFNNNITRQKLPGFHAAQITNMGWQSKSLEEGGLEGVTYAKNLKYHPDGEPYIEVMLPASFVGVDKTSEHYKNMSDEEILKELEAKGLLDVIGYRIPTEGKQSVCNMKVVGFTSDAYGSTIVVPDDWVSQTGSDFDIDSVYGVQFETYKTSKGEVKKVEYKKQMTKSDYFNYVNRFANEYKDPNVSEKIKQAISEINTIFNEEYNKLQKEESEIYDSLDNKSKDGIKKLNEKVNKEIAKKDYKGNTAYRYRLARYTEHFSKQIAKAKKTNTPESLEYIEKTNKFLDKLDELDEFLDTQTGRFSEAKEKRITQILESRQNAFEAIAKKAGLMTMDEFLNPANIDKANGRQACNTRICEIMQKVLSHPASLEENLSRSNFDEITIEKNELMPEDMKNKRKYRSPYNVIDQIAYQEDAMSGAKLKAFSVTLDTFCSVCNTVRPELVNPVYIVYDKKNRRYQNLSDIAFSFGEDFNGKAEGTFSIRHRRYGWSVDNRNVRGKLLTSYSSQTTAYILDAIKEGALPNLNDYTFAAFKTLINAGTDYHTAIAFLMQPGMTRIVDNYNSNNSVYTYSGGNVIHKAIKQIAKELGIKANDDTPIKDVIDKLNERYGKDFNNLFRQKGDKAIEISLEIDKIQDLPINVPLMIARLNDKGKFGKRSPVEKKLLMDLGTVLSFYKLNETAREIGDIARCCNPDKFGAKQTVYATRKVFDNIDNILYHKDEIIDPTVGQDEEGNTIMVKTPRPQTLTVDGKHILEAIYPGVADPNADVDTIVNNLVNSKDAKSAYPTLYSFLKYSTATSCVLARSVLETQNPSFVRVLDGFKSVLSGFNPSMSEDTYVDLQRYVLSSLYKEVPSIKFEVNVKTDGKGYITLEHGKVEPRNEDEARVNQETLESIRARQETARIYGYGHASNLSVVTTDEEGNAVVERFEVKDMNNVTQEEVELFEQFSPAQKVQWIKGHFDDAGLFDYLDTQLFNDNRTKKYVGMQSLKYVDQNVSNNVIFEEFREAFFNSNPLIVSAAIDVVKYAVQVEGLRIGATAVNKVIDNDCLINEFGSNGLGFVKSVTEQMGMFGTLGSNYATTKQVRTLYENYLRSHPETPGIKSVFLTQKNINKYHLDQDNFGIYYLKKGEDSKAFDELMTTMGVKYYLPKADMYKSNAYIRLKNYKQDNLYKIKDYGSYIILYPLGNLQRWENSEWSVKEDNNNKILSKRAYERLCADYMEQHNEAVFGTQYIAQKLNEYIKSKEIGDVTYTNRKKVDDRVPAREFNLTEHAKDYGPLAHVFQAIVSQIGSRGYNTIYVRSSAIQDYIFSPGIEYGSVQEIKFEGGRTRKFMIMIPEDIKEYEDAFLKGKNTRGIKLDGEILNPDDITNKSLRDIVIQAQGDAYTNSHSAGKRIVNKYSKEGLAYTNLNGVVKIMPLEEDMAYASSFEEDDDVENVEASEEVLDEENSLISKFSSITSETIDFANSLVASNSDKLSLSYKEKLRSNTITNEVETIEAKKVVAARETARYAKAMVDYIKHKLIEDFAKDPAKADSAISLTDPRAMAIISQNPQLMDKALRAVNISQAFIKTFSPYIELDATSENEEIQGFIKDIKEAIEELNKLPITEISENIVKTIADRESNNPILKDGLISVFDGFWKTYGGMWYFNDIMENGTPILQVIMKDVMGDIDAKQKNFKHKVQKAFWEKIKDIQKKAQERGETIDWTHIVDDYGRFVQDYTEQYVEDLNRLRNEAKDAAAIHGYGSIEHLAAKLEYDKFKALYCNQPAGVNYYIEKCNIEHKLMFGGEEKTVNDVTGEEITTHTRGRMKLYSKYMKLFYEKLDLYNYMSENGLNEAQRKRLNEITKAMWDLTNTEKYFDEAEQIYKDRPFEDYGEHTQEEHERLDEISKEAAYDLKKAIDALFELNNKYFTKEEEYGFTRQLKLNQEIVSSFEDRDANGIPTRPQDWLESQPAYVEARDWIKHNARFKVEAKLDDQGQPYGIGAILEKANAILKRGRNGKSNATNEICRTANGGEGIYDERGVPDGRLLTEEELNDIRERQREIYQISALPPFTDRILLSNARPTGAVFKPEFYAGMKSNTGQSNPEYLRAVTELNKLLEPLYSSIDNCIHFEDIEDTPEGIELLNQIAIKYQEIRAIKGSDTSPKDPNAKAFIEDNVEFVTNTTIWEAQKLAAKNRSKAFKEAWLRVSLERDSDGNFITNKDGDVVPNRFLYSYAKPKGKPGTKEYDNWLDTERQEALDTIHRYYRRTTTKYYHQAKNEAMRRAETDENFDYNDWYNANHIYNPYTRRMEPLECWITSEVRSELFSDDSMEGRWIPRGTKTQRKVRDGKTTITVLGETTEIHNEKDDMRNTDYNEDAGLVKNFAKKSPHAAKYLNPVSNSMNQSEKDMRDYLQEVLQSTATTEAARRFFQNGYLPMAMKNKETNAKLVASELGKLFGFNISTDNGNKDFYEEIGYEKDVTPLMPMTKLLESKQTIDLSKKIKELKDKEITRESFNSDDEFEQAVKENTKLIEEYEKQLKTERANLQNKDWLNVIDAFLEQSSRYNAINDNKQKLYFLLNTLRNMKMYSREFGGSGDLKADRRKDKDGKILEKTVDDKLIKQYENQLRRLLFDQWKEKQGKNTRIANALQGFTSANYMMLNVRGGIANVTLGMTGMLAEAAAGDYIGRKELQFGISEWVKGSIGFARGGYESMFNNDSASYNKQDAIIKFFNVVDYDEVTGVCREMSLETYSKKIRDAMFSPQTMGEHFMQNSVLFGMLKSHKLVTDERGDTVFMAKREYIDFRLGQLLNEVLTDEQKAEFDKFKKELKKDKNKVKDYATFRKDVLTDFVAHHLSKAQINEFIKKRKEQEKAIEKEFDDKLSLYDQVELGTDGKLIFKDLEVDEPTLAKLDNVLSKRTAKKYKENKDGSIKTENDSPFGNISELSEAMVLCGRFAEKVRKVNNKIHGVYNRQGAAYIEKTWWGSLLMQYHKHLPMGIQKRYLSRGYYNETRNSVEKGMVQSIIDIATLNFDRVKIEAGLREDQVDALKGFTFLLTHAFQYLTELKTTWNIIPGYERDNVYRNVGDLIGVVAGMATVAALWYIADDDDKMQEGIGFNLALYEADRLASEAFLYNPIGLFNEGKKLMSTPIAAQSIISDALSSIKSITDYLTDDEYDPYYQSGRFAGERKLWVYAQRRMPIWNGIRGILDTPSNNSYYKLGQNPIGIFNIKDKVTKD